MNLLLYFKLTFKIVFIFVWICRRAGAQKSKDFWDRLQEVNVFASEEKNSISFHDGARPSPSDQLPIVDLEENPDPVFDPKPSDIDYRTLRRILGKDYDRKFMTAVRPLEHVLNPNGTLEFKMKKNRPKGRRPMFIKYFGKHIRVGNDRYMKLSVSRRTRKKIQKYLWNYTHCPIYHTWKDLGIRFWPRWIREGQCYRGRSCSIPPGMYCKQSNSTMKTLLRWHCKGQQKGTECRWIKFQYPILTECTCSCV